MVLRRWRPLCLGPEPVLAQLVLQELLCGLGGVRRGAVLHQDGLPGCKPLLDPRDHLGQDQVKVDLGVDVGVGGKMMGSICCPSEAMRANPLPDFSPASQCASRHLQLPQAAGIGHFDGSRGAYKAMLGKTKR